MATSSFRLPPPLSSTVNATNTNSNSTNETFSSSRARSLENINAQEKKISQIDINSSQQSTKSPNLQSLDETHHLSSSTESTNGIPFANENVGTIKQRSPHNQTSNLYNPALNPMKRSLPIQFFEQTIKPSYPLTTAIYDNNERFIANNLMRKPTTVNGEKRSPYKQTKVVK